MQDIHAKTVEVIKAGLLKLGLITDPRGDQYRLWYTHGASHYIGIDVHDVGSRTRALQPGMAFTIEPGIYIRQSALDALPRTPENIAFIEQVQPAVRKYADIGVRIEDSFLLEDSGLRNLSASVPKTIEAIEAFLRARPHPGRGDNTCDREMQNAQCTMHDNGGIVHSTFCISNAVSCPRFSSSASRLSTPPPPRAISSGRSPARPASCTWSAPFIC